MNCVTTHIPECPQSKLLAAHSESLDKAHRKLRGHDLDIEQLKSQAGNCLARLEAVELSQLDTQRALIRIDGRLSNFESRIKAVGSTSESMHQLIVQHIAHGILIEEGTWKRIIRLTGILGSILVLLALIYSARSDQFWSIVTGFMG